jgi:pyruvate formate lyase activating enzyme
MAGAEARKVTPQAFVQEALRFKARIVTSTYNEPLITSEWAMAIFKEARKHGLGTSYVSNGNATNEVLDYIQPFTDLYKIDLKTFQDRNYRQLGGTLEAVLDTVKGVYKRGIWLEIVTLVVPTFNDSDDELRQIAEFLVDVSPNIPWHVTAFHKDYKMTDPVNTPPTTLVRAADIGKEAGLNFVYAGNTPGMVESYEDTVCPNCNTTLIRRWGFSIREYSLTEDKKCPECTQSIPGIWERPSKREYDYPIVVS